MPPVGYDCSQRACGSSDTSQGFFDKLSSLYDQGVTQAAFYMGNFSVLERDGASPHGSDSAAALCPMHAMMSSGVA